jgi:PAS domain S-box-containing protein
MQGEQKEIKVLHIDDEPDLLALTKAYLERVNEDLNIDSVTSAEEGMVLLKDGNYDVVLSDYMMPEMDGLEFLKIIRESGNEIPFIMFTGKGRELVAIEALNKGANHYLQKGGDAESLYRTVGHMIKDVVAKKWAEDALNVSETRYRRLFETAQDGILLLDADTGQITDVNPFLIALLGYSHEELIGKKLWEIGLFVNRAVSQSSFKELQEKRYIRYENLPLETKTGKLINAEFVSNVYQVDGGNVIQCNIRDITDRKRAEDELTEIRDHRERFLRELEAKNRELEYFTYTVSHDLGSPLFAIQGFTSLARGDLERGEIANVEEYLKRIENATMKMDRLLEDTLQLSRIGRVINPPEDIPFAEIVEDAQNQVEGQINSSGVDVSVVKNFPTVRVDRLRIIEVLVNLIGNSLKYVGEQSSPKIDIGFHVDSDETVFFVKDNGRGIDPSLHQRVFELFFQGDKRIEGTGAGLAIVKRIIEVHGGRIWIDSEKGKGCTVCFTLPVP